jgi:hypothetical protein
MIQAFIGIALLSIVFPVSGLVVNEKLLARRNIQRLIENQSEQIVREFYEGIVELSNLKKIKIQYFDSYVDFPILLHRTDQLCIERADQVECDRKIKEMITTHDQMHQSYYALLSALTGLKITTQSPWLKSLTGFLNAEKFVNQTNSNLRLLYVDMTLNSSFNKTYYDKMKNEFSLSLRFSLHSFAALLPPSIHKETIQFWSQFIAPLTNIILIQKEFSQFPLNLEQLNFSLNQFTFHLEKNKQKLPSKTRSQFKIIHRRWNNILRNILKN